MASEILAPEITVEVLQQTAGKLGVKVPQNVEHDFAELMRGTREAILAVAAMEDFVPPADLDKYPRTDVVHPPPEHNPYNAWATKATVIGAKEGILSGKTLVLKDNICLAGVPCEFGTKVFSDWVPNTDATVVKRILDAGVTITGKATCENFCAYGASNTSAHGPVGNPYDKTRSSGGSSSGCGVLVAIGEVDMAIGADQGGSIRMPASQVGIVGLKPTFGLVPYTGIISSETSIDHAGPMTRDILTNAQLLKVIAGVDGLDDRQIAGTPFPNQVPDYPALLARAKSAHALLSIAEQGTGPFPGNPRKLRVGILKEGFTFQELDPHVASLVKEAAKKFEELGAEVIEISVPGHSQAVLVGRVHRLTQYNNLLGRTSGTRQIYQTDLTQEILPWTQEKFDKLWYVSAGLLLQGQYCDEYYPYLHGKTHNLVRKLRYEYDDALSKVDVLLMPTLPWVAKKLLGQDVSPSEHMKDYSGFNTNTVPFNMTGHPALSIPCGMLPPPEGPEDLRLPVGLQLVGKYHDELTLYKAALAWSDAYDWKTL
ncbi:amidase signature enzyme [Irpex rosettiformis]|uniref:Amidase signature enzyme n=1 Tax=Irpex rosettiformis TaxID=378272 RepID=A0ACB8UA03_9APHY|nr:amidase signature enzyme [Irpex rosettiformis]